MAQAARQNEGAIEERGEIGAKVLRAWLVESQDFGPHGAQDRLVADGVEEKTPQAVGLRPLLPKLSMSLGRWGLTLRYLEKGDKPKTFIIPVARVRRLELE